VPDVLVGPRDIIARAPRMQRTYPPEKTGGQGTKANGPAFPAGTGNRDMRDCALCKRPIRPLADWKGHDGRFYCSEFCADAGEFRELVGSKLPEMVATAAILGRQNFRKA
jgi:hypothetical protein